MKTSLLLHAMGSDGIEVFNTFHFAADDKTDTGAGKYEKVMDKFHAYFVNVTYERHRFFTRNRQPGESVDKYVPDLRTLAQPYDRLVCGIGDTRLQERLLRVNDLDLGKALDICRATETSQEQLLVLNAMEWPRKHPLML